jgi:hypothetical protein
LRGFCQFFILENVMRVALSRRRQPRGSLALVLTAGLLFLGACATPANEGFVPMNDHPTPFRQAHAACWESSWGSGYTGGNSTFGDAMNRYNACMARAGWAASTHMF